MCRMGLCLAHLMYITCIENAGRWSSDYEYYISSDYESAAKKSQRMEFSCSRAADQSRRVFEDSPSVMWNVKCVVP